MDCRKIPTGPQSGWRSSIHVFLFPSKFCFFFQEEWKISILRYLKNCSTISIIVYGLMHNVNLGYRTTQSIFFRWKMDNLEKLTKRRISRTHFTNFNQIFTKKTFVLCQFLGKSAISPIVNTLSVSVCLSVRHFAITGRRLANIINVKMCYLWISIFAIEWGHCENCSL